MFHLLRRTTLEDLAKVPVVLSERELSQVLSFLAAYDDPAATDLIKDVPAGVPSGLPVAD